MIKQNTKNKKNVTCKCKTRHRNGYSRTKSNMRQRNVRQNWVTIVFDRGNIEASEMNSNKEQ